MKVFKYINTIATVVFLLLCFVSKFISEEFGFLIITLYYATFLGFFQVSSAIGLSFGNKNFLVYLGLVVLYLFTYIYGSSTLEETFGDLEEIFGATVYQFIGVGSPIILSIFFSILLLLTEDPKKLQHSENDSIDEFETQEEL